MTLTCGDCRHFKSLAGPLIVHLGYCRHELVKELGLCPMCSDLDDGPCRGFELSDVPRKMPAKHLVETAPAPDSYPDKVSEETTPEPAEPPRRPRRLPDNYRVD